MATNKNEPLKHLLKMFQHMQKAPTSRDYATFERRFNNAIESHDDLGASLADAYNLVESKADVATLYEDHDMFKVESITHDADRGTWTITVKA